MLRNRWLVVGIWLVVFILGGYANSKLPNLLSNTFTMPGTDSERARTILQQHYNDRSDGAFTIVFTVPNASDPQQRARLQAAMTSAAKLVPSGEARPLTQGSAHVLYGDIVGSERKMGSAVNERYADLKPQFDDLMKRVSSVLTTDVATFNTAATRAGAGGITIK